MLYLASLCLYIQARLLEDKENRTSRLSYAGSLLAAVLAMFTKEMTITLPLMVLLYEFCFLKDQKGMNKKTLWPFLATFLPIHQNLDYDYPILKSLIDPSFLVSLLLLIIILIMAQRLFSKYRLISFSIFWFFLTLLPESSIIPIRETSSSNTDSTCRWWDSASFWSAASMSSSRIRISKS